MWDCQRWHGKHAGFRRGGSSISNPVRLKATRLGGAQPNPVLSYLVLLFHFSVSTQLGGMYTDEVYYVKYREWSGIGNLSSLGSVMRPHSLLSSVGSGSGQTYPTWLGRCIQVYPPCVCVGAVTRKVYNVLWRLNLVIELLCCPLMPIQTLKYSWHNKQRSNSVTEWKLAEESVG